MRKKSRRPTEKLQKEKKNRTCEAHRNQVDAGQPEENRKRRSEQKHKKEDFEKTQPH